MTKYNKRPIILPKMNAEYAIRRYNELFNNNQGNDTAVWMSDNEEALISDPEKFDLIMNWLHYVPNWKTSPYPVVRQWVMENATIAERDHL